jgi:hypothetical protein
MDLGRMSDDVQASKLDITYKRICKGESLDTKPLPTRSRAVARSASFPRSTGRGKQTAAPRMASEMWISARCETGKQA